MVNVSAFGPVAFFAVMAVVIGTTLYETYKTRRNVTSHRSYQSGSRSPQLMCGLCQGVSPDTYRLSCSCSPRFHYQCINKYWMESNHQKCPNCSRNVGISYRI